MTTEIVQFIQNRHIDSFQKLRVLIFFYEHAESSWTRSQIAARLYLGDGPLLEKIMADLGAVGLVDCVARGCRLREEAGIKLGLQHLVKRCENPLARQEILDRVRCCPRPSPVIGKAFRKFFNELLATLPDGPAWDALDNNTKQE